MNPPWRALPGFDQTPTMSAEMTREAFWQPVEDVIAKTQGDLSRFENELDIYLRSLAHDDIANFAQVFTECLNETDTAGIYDAACIIGCGNSADGLLDFRRWIVVQGRSNFARILKQPDFLGTYDRRANPIEHWYCEFDPGSIRHEVTSKDSLLPQISVTAWPTKSRRELSRQYPLLWMRIHNADQLRVQLQERASKLFVGATLSSVSDCNGFSRFVFSTGAEIHIYNYHCPEQVADSNSTDSAATRLHSSVGQSVVSLNGNFPDAFHIWFANRRKLAFGLFNGWPTFAVFDGAEQLYP